MADLPFAPPKETPLSRLHHRRYLRVFPILSSTVTVFVRASNCRVVVLYHELEQVELYASLYAAFGMRLVVEQDEAGIYVIAHRRRFFGMLSRSELTVKVPTYCQLVFNLTPGTVQVEDFSGILEIPAVTLKSSAVTLDNHQLKKLPPNRINQIETGK